VLHGKGDPGAFRHGGGAPPEPVGRDPDLEPPAVARYSRLGDAHLQLHAVGNQRVLVRRRLALEVEDVAVEGPLLLLAAFGQLDGVVLAAPGDLLPTVTLSLNRCRDATGPTKSECE
jgi:hypothetical protein